MAGKQPCSPCFNDHFFIPFLANPALGFGYTLKGQMNADFFYLILRSFGLGSGDLV